MNDDWRLRVDFRESGLVHKALERLNASELEHNLETAFHDRVIVSVDGAELFCYAGTREQLDAAQALIRELAAEHGWQISCDLKHWHPSAEDWEDPDKPLPGDDAERAAERAQLMAKERAESDQLGAPAYEVRVTCPTRQAAAELAEQLRAEGQQNVQRSNFLLIGAPDEDSAGALAERLRQRTPAGSIVTTEASAGTVLAESGNPFAVFGGLAG